MTARRPLPRMARGDPAAGARVLAERISDAIVKAEAIGADDVAGHLRMALLVAERRAVVGHRSVICLQLAGANRSTPAHDRPFLLVNVFLLKIMKLGAPVRERTMGRSAGRTNAVTRVEEGSPQDRVAQALYEHDARRAKVLWHPWRLSTRPKQLLYLSRAAVAIVAVNGSKNGTTR